MILPSNRRVEYLNLERNFYDPHIASKNALRKLREETTRKTNKINLDRSKKIFVSREDAGRRMLKNREEVLEILKSRGFKSYKLAELSFEEQVYLFSNAEKIVGVHGAGLTNILFSSNAEVVEIFGALFKPTYYLMAEALGINYHAVSGRSINNNQTKLLNQDIEIDPKKLSSALN